MTVSKLQIFYLFLLLVQISAFVNPVINNQNVPDPGVILFQGQYYVVTTGGDQDKFPIHRSNDLQDWQQVGFVFQQNNLPDWTTHNSDFWAPELHIVNGQFRVYFTARESNSNILCIGVGYANNILGPYTDRGVPLVRDTNVGSIDCNVFIGINNVHYLIWKDDGNGNRPQKPTWIWAQQLTDDGLSIVGAKYALIRNDLPWEGDVTEGPWIIKRGDFYYLFYSGFSYADETYAVGVARSNNPLGPYVKKGDPILRTYSRYIGPGHCSVIQQNNSDEFVMIYHSWLDGAVGGNNNRVLMVDTVKWDGNQWPYMQV